MNGKDPRDPREATLRRLVRDARAEPAPELDWARLEQRLLVEAGRRAVPAKRSRYPYAWGALAAAVSSSAKPAKLGSSASNARSSRRA